MSRILPELVESPEFRAFHLYPLVPNLGRYHDDWLGGGTAGLLDSIMKDVSWTSKASALVRGGWSYVTKNPRQALRAGIKIEMENIYQTSGVRQNVVAVYLHEFYTDTCLSLGIVDLLLEYCDYLRDSYHVLPGLQTRNLPLLVRRFQETKHSLDGIAVMTPLNPVGFQMTPTQSACEAALDFIDGPLVTAISVLAGGRVPVRDARAYLDRLPKVQSVAVGGSNISHIIESFAELAKIQHLHRN